MNRCITCYRAAFGFMTTTQAGPIYPLRHLIIILILVVSKRVRLKVNLAAISLRFALLVCSPINPLVRTTRASGICNLRRRFAAAVRLAAI